MSMGPVKDTFGNLLNPGDQVEVTEEIIYLDNNNKTKNKILKGTKYKVLGFPTNERAIQVKHKGTDWVLPSSNVKKI